MYALARNAWKYVDRDKRTDKTQLIEFDFLAPDSVGEMISALELFRIATGRAWVVRHEVNKKYSDEQFSTIGGNLLEESPDGVPRHELDGLEIFAEGFENSDRKVRLIKVPQAYQLFRELIAYYAATRLVSYIRLFKPADYEAFHDALPSSLPLTKWHNVGGQLIRYTELEKFLGQIRNGRVREWSGVHAFYARQSENYEKDKMQHALAALKTTKGTDLRRAGKQALKDLLLDSIATKEWMAKGIYTSRAKDYTNPFRKMVYDSPEEMNTVIGALRDNSFIRQEKESAKKYRKEVEGIIKKFKL
jgi:hypothetical protein